MRSKTEFKKLTKEELWEEFELRGKLANEMIGTLYPAVLEREMEELLRLFQPSQFDQLELPV